MSCAHAFGEWCPECIAGVVADYNRARTELATAKTYLKRALSEMGVDRRTISRCIDVDPAGNTYEVTLKPWVREAVRWLGERPGDYE